MGFHNLRPIPSDLLRPGPVRAGLACWWFLARLSGLRRSLPNERGRGVLLPIHLRGALCR